MGICRRTSGHLGSDLVEDSVDLAPPASAHHFISSRRVVLLCPAHFPTCAILSQAPNNDAKSINFSFLYYEPKEPLCLIS